VGLQQKRGVVDLWTTSVSSFTTPCGSKPASLMDQVVNQPGHPEFLRVSMPSYGAGLQQITVESEQEQAPYLAELLALMSVHTKVDGKVSKTVKQYVNPGSSPPPFLSHRCSWRGCSGFRMKLAATVSSVRLHVSLLVRESETLCAKHTST